MADQFMNLRQEVLQTLFELRDNSLSSLREQANGPNMTIERLTDIMTHVTALREGINDPMGIWNHAPPAAVEAPVEVPGNDNSPPVTVTTDEEDD